jgi:hypothetical protein
VLLVVSGFLAVSVYLGQHHRLHVLNGLTRGLSIQIDDGSTVVIEGEGRETIAIGEGGHQVKILGPIGPSTPGEFVVRTPFWTRLFYRPVFLLDPLRTCVVYRETTKYSEVPSDEDESIDARAGELFVQFPPTDYLFHEFRNAAHRQPASAKWLRRESVLLGSPREHLEFAQLFASAATRTGAHTAERWIRPTRNF